MGPRYAEYDLTYVPYVYSAQKLSMEGRGGKEEPSSQVAGPAAASGGKVASDVRYIVYTDENQLAPIMALVDRDLSEPYSIFTYRYFLHGWPDLCFVVSRRLSFSMNAGCACSSRF